MDELIKERYREWSGHATFDPDLLAELASMDERAVEEAFGASLSFGTAGLRGVIGAGTNRMNVYTVAKASRAMAIYAKRLSASPSVAIAYDSRIKSELFARTAAAAFAAEGVTVHLFPELEPTPCLSFAVRYLRCDCGVMVTASHNPAEYNGYKAYGSDGCQMTEDAAGAVYEIMETLPVLECVPERPFEAYLSEGSIRWIGPDVMDAYIEKVKEQSVADGMLPGDLKIVYTPLNGAGRKPVLRILSEIGLQNVIVVKEQEEPDGRFPTCPYPNPEMREAMELGIRTCEENGADLLIATDPDSDRLSIAVRTETGAYRILTGNELGCILLDFLIERRTALKTMPERAVMVKSIVTTDLARKIAEAHGVEARSVLTGFKYIGEQIGRLERDGEEERFLFGFEESCGFLSGSYVRDKDAVVASMLAAEAFVYRRAQGKSLIDRLNELFTAFGYHHSEVHQLSYPGLEGKKTMADLMAALRRGVDSFGNDKVTSVIDYAEGVRGLPPANVLVFNLESGSEVIVRPSGTEPKIKVYVTTSGESESEAEALAETVFTSVKERL